jgi:beta-glucosidase
VTLKLGARDQSMVNDAGTRLIAAGDYTLFIGGGQPGTGAAGLSVPLKIEGDQKLDR